VGTEAEYTPHVPLASVDAGSVRDNRCPLVGLRGEWGAWGMKNKTKVMETSDTTATVEVGDKASTEHTITGRPLGSVPKGHMQITTVMMREAPTTMMKSARMVSTYSFDHSFKVIIPKKEAWLNSEKLPLPSDSSVVYTDGSCSTGKTGAGVYIESPGHKEGK